MEKPAPTETFPAPTAPSIGARAGVGRPHPPGRHPISAPRATVSRPTRVLICVENAGVRELISLLLADAGYAVADIDVLPWLVGNPVPGPPPEVLILDAWPLRHADAATQAHARLAAQPAAVVLLLDSSQPVHLAAQLLPLLFSLHDLITAMQQGTSARTEGAQAADAVGHGI